MSRFISRDTVGDDKNVKGCSLGGTDVLMTSSGISSLDSIVGDGFPMGSLNCIREDRPRSTSNFSNSILKCIIAEGFQCGHYILYFDGIEEDINSWLRAIPSPVKAEESLTATSSDPNGEKMTIAWRYKHLKKLDEGLAVPFGRNKKTEVRSYDLGKCLSEGSIRNYARLIRTVSVFEADFANKLLEQAKRLAETATSEGTVLRLVIRSYASPLWDNTTSAPLMLYRLRRLLYTFPDNCIIFLSIPAYIYSDNVSVVADLENQADLVIELQSFAGTPKEESPSLTEYCGFLKIIKPMRNPGLLSLALPGSCDIAFKLKRKQLIFEPFHMPPDLGESPSRFVDPSTGQSNCSLLKQTKLDF